MQKPQPPAALMARDCFTFTYHIFLQSKQPQIALPLVIVYEVFYIAANHCKCKTSTHQVLSCLWQCGYGISLFWMWCCVPGYLDPAVARQCGCLTYKGLKLELKILEDGPLHCLETLGTKYPVVQHHIPKQPITQLHIKCIFLLHTWLPLREVQQCPQCQWGISLVVQSEAGPVIWIANKSVKLVMHFRRHIFGIHYPQGLKEYSVTDYKQYHKCNV